ncbi:unnamed protein product [Symbiodinium natans]|uniref:Uncharacterized protein n=1 Tax=Symbiodinium natans TaxID=878477 RepID=A0A812UIZ9_9DINO|nr:unnamed protein product [Symbiodinium natans]
MTSFILWLTCNFRNCHLGTFSLAHNVGKCHLRDAAMAVGKPSGAPTYGSLIDTGRCEYASLHPMVLIAHGQSGSQQVGALLRFLAASTKQAESGSSQEQGELARAGSRHWPGALCIHVIE